MPPFFSKLRRGAMIGLAAPVLFVCVACSPPTSDSAAAGAEKRAVAKTGDAQSAPENRNVIDRRGAPQTHDETGVSVFLDQGAWHGYGLGESDAQGEGVAGPFLLTNKNGYWMAKNVGELQLFVDGAPVEFSAVERYSAPGRLVLKAEAAKFERETTLIFAEDRTALFRAAVTNTSDEAVVLEPRWVADGFLGEMSVSARDEQILLTFPDAAASVETRAANAAATPDITGKNQFALVYDDRTTVAPGKTAVFYLAQSSYFDKMDRAKRIDAQTDALADPEAAFAANAARWNGYLAAIDRQAGPLMHDPAHRRLAIKAIETLISNWRGATGDLLHDGVVPSHAVRYFQGFWAWDSWKHAVALARFEPELAKENIRAMFDYQDERGMVADVIYRDKSENNWRDTKPPLAAWAVEAVYRATGDAAFVEEMLPALTRYHRWWYQDRDHDGDGLAEYGSTDGTRIAAAWESGMDNAVRFDDAEIVKNNDSAWSLDQESVDLNAYLYAEKLFLAELCEAVGDARASAQYRSDAEELKVKIRKQMFDAENRYFYDINAESGAPVRVEGPEGWTPLWAKLASDEEAASVREIMIDPKKFATHVPFPTLAADHEKLDPAEGYWRGPVWLDQAYFGVKALENYGYQEDADALRAKLFRNATGMLTDAPLHENYNPLTGDPLNAPHFSWSAAHVLLLLLKDEAPAR